MEAMENAPEDGEEGDASPGRRKKFAGDEPKSKACVIC